MPSLVRPTFFAATILFLGTAILPAQQPADAPSGTVSGVVTCSDTQRPARFASVTLTPVPDDKPAVKPMSDKEAEADPAAAMKLVTERMGTMTMLQGQTGLDGAYTIANVPPGDYYVSSTEPGYVSSMAAARAAAPPGAKGKAMYPGVTVVHVEANHTAHGDLTLDRGAAVMGTVAFDDGAPAGKVMVMIEKVEPSKASDDSGFSSADVVMAMAGGAGSATITDDRGHFRIAGIAPGDYTLRTTLQVNSSFSMRGGVMDMSALLKASPLVFYSPGTVHKKDAKKITLAGSEEHGDLNITVDLNGMHSVSGRIASAVDHHGLNEATVELTDVNDKKFTRKAGVDPTGAFTITYVPPGTYTLEVSGGADTEPAKKKPGGLVNFSATHTLKSYETATQQVIVDATDVTGVNIELKESKTTKKDFDMNDFLKQ
ncbi:MAG TPA: carboxypeptidase-like regulatory domain-containing protein [Acidobacteriaceae bacterium]|nr:carboxypeptidase-like regulatory domain-containing protein [Acidobacteriaceae bacterium]